MGPEMALARTTAQTGRYVAWTPGGGVEGFSFADTAHALAGAPRLGAMIVLAKYGAGTPADVIAIAVEAGHRIATLVTAPRGTAVAGIAIMRGAVAETLGTTICLTCEGRCFTVREARLAPCVDCAATGRTRWTPARRAVACGVTPAVLLSTSWGRIYDEARRLLIGEEMTALDYVARRLRNFHDG